MDLITKKQLQRDHNNKCSFCEKPFIRYDPVYFGIDRNGKNHLVSNCCENKIFEIEPFDHFPFLPYIIPEDNVTLWRFMDFSKFISILNEKSLFFTSVLSLEKMDPFEGAVSSEENKEHFENHLLKLAKGIELFTPKVLKAPNEGTFIKKPEESIEFHKRLRETYRELTFASCWHSNESESEAMWKLYSTNHKDAIALKLSVSDLNKSLSPGYFYEIGFINYIDFSPLGFFLEDYNKPFWFKRDSFKHENEVRVIIQDQAVPSNKKGFFVPVDLNILLKEIIVSPTCEDWFFKTVKSTLEEYKMKSKVLKSTLSINAFH